MCVCMWRNQMSREPAVATSNTLGHRGVLAARRGRRHQDGHLGAHRLHLRRSGCGSRGVAGGKGSVGRRGGGAARRGAAGSAAVWLHGAARPWRRTEYLRLLARFTHGASVFCA